MDLGDALEALLPLNVTASECVGDAWLKQHDTMLVKEHQVGSHAHETISRDTTHGSGKLCAGHYLSWSHIWPCLAPCRALTSNGDSSDELRSRQQSPHQKGAKLPESESGYHTQVESHGRNTVCSGLGLRVAAHMPTERQYRKNVSQFRTVPRASTMLTEGCGRYASSTEPLSKASSKTPR